VAVVRKQKKENETRSAIMTQLTKVKKNALPKYALVRVLRSWKHLGEFSESKGNPLQNQHQAIEQALIRFTFSRTTPKLLALPA